MALPFHRRIFVILVTMTAVPTILAVAGWVLSVRTLAPSAGARASLEEVVTSARALAQGVDTMQLTPAARAALRHHLERVSSSASLARRGETYLHYYTAGFAIVIVMLGVVVLFAAVRLAGHRSSKRCARRCATSPRRSTSRATRSSRPNACARSARWRAAWRTRSK